MKTLTLTVLTLLLSTHAFSQEIGYDELKRLDPEIDQKLEDVGFQGKPENLSIVVHDDEKIEARLESSETGVEPLTNPKKNLWVAGLVLSSVYHQGAQYSYLHYNPKREKVMYHMDASLSGNFELTNFTLSFDQHIGKWGLFAGVNGQLVRYRPSLIDHSKTYYIPGQGVEIGWQKAWGQSQRIVTTMKAGSMITYYKSFIYVMPEVSVGVGINLSKLRKKN